jgi:hypothetical protein
MLLGALLARFVSLAHSAQIAYCSPDNTGADTGFQAGIDDPSLLYLSRLMLFDQCTISSTQMARVRSNVKIPTPSLFSKDPIAGARIMPHLIRSKQIFVMNHVPVIQVTGVDLVRQVCTATLP